MAKFGPKPRPFAERYWELVDRRGDDDCWLWLGTTNNGYGKYQDGKRKTSAHRFAYELTTGPIPGNLPLDHTCHDSAVCLDGSLCPHRRCCNPSHLEPVTDAENLRRMRPNNALASVNAAKSHCPHGHPYDEVNTIVHGDGRRRCRSCRNERTRATYWRKRRSLV